MSITLPKRARRGGTEAQEVSAVAAHARAQRHQWVAGQESPRLFTIFPPVLLGSLLLLTWYIVTATGAVPAYILPGWSDVLGALSDGFASGLFLSNAWVTIQESLGGFLIAVVFALPIGYGLARGRVFAATLQPYLVAGQAVPAVVLAPFLVIWLGYGIVDLLVLCALVVFFPLEITVALGFQTIERDLIEAARVEGAGFWPLLVRIELPLALPSIMAAVRTGLTLSVVGALVGEFVNNSDQGLGALVQIAKSQYNVPLMFATVLVLALLASIFYGIARSLTKLSETISG